jgi:hypothetical protein
MAALTPHKTAHPRLNPRLVGAQRTFASAWTEATGPLLMAEKEVSGVCREP